ncbi:hypothetical protein [uncultured Helicobacter sp.]|uniref:hypothetical protein n=1 Tax=uncultured Helicobacter sp. TaxID=175537 RepID=UPI001C399695|nr:hypothetical protein [Candidatus Helicobacter avicola]
MNREKCIESKITNNTAGVINLSGRIQKMYVREAEAMRGFAHITDTQVLLHKTCIKI